MLITGSVITDESDCPDWSDSVQSILKMRNHSQARSDSLDTTVTNSGGIFRWL